MKHNDMWNELEEGSKAPMTSAELKDIVWKQGTERFLELFREQVIPPLTTEQEEAFREADISI
jgi:hypothetical protein